MINKKSRFFTFIFSFIPGAGEMYMGFFKQGVSIMLITFAFIAFSSMINCGPLLAILPVLWFYSFFHVHALASMKDEDFYQLEDHYLFNLNDQELNQALQTQKMRKIIAALLIVIGASTIWHLGERALERLLPNYYNAFIGDILYAIPQLILAALVIFAGIYLIRGKKKELDEEQTEQKLIEEIQVED